MLSSLGSLSSDLSSETILSWWFWMLNSLGSLSRLLALTLTKLADIHVWVTIDQDETLLSLLQRCFLLLSDFS